MRMIQATQTSDLDGLSSPVEGSSHVHRYTLSGRRFAAVNFGQECLWMGWPLAAPPVHWKAASLVTLCPTRFALRGKLNLTIRISLISSNSHENVGEYTGALHSTTNVQCTYHHELVTGDVSMEGNVISFRGVEASQDILRYYEQVLDNSTHELETRWQYSWSVLLSKYLVLL